MNWSDWDRSPPGEALRETDPEIAELIEHEIARQNDGLELIASENFVSPAVLEALGSPLTNKYAEGLPGKRYYGGCEWIDQVEQIAIDRAKQLFGAEHANVQPHSGDRKSTRLNSSHSQISYAVFCLKKKKRRKNIITQYGKK